MAVGTEPRVFGNVVTDLVNAHAADAVDAWFAWSETDEAARRQHRRRRLLHRAGELAPLRSREHGPLRRVRLERHPARGGGDLLRRTRPDLPWPFRMPLVPLLPTLSALVSLLLMLSLPWSTWERLILWMAIGVAVYFGYGFRHSRLCSTGSEAPRAARAVEG